MESIIQELNELQDHGPCLRLPCRWNPNTAFLEGLKSQIHNAKLWLVLLKEFSPMKAFILKLKIFNLTEGRVLGNSEGSGHNLAHF